nr:Sel1 domain-containing protein [Ciona robusta]
MRRRRISSTNLQSAVDVDDYRRKPAVRCGNLVKLGNNVFRLQDLPEDSWLCRSLEIIGLFVVVLLVYVTYFHYESLHFHVAKGYGHLGYAPAQHVVGQRYLTGRGAPKNETEAMKWFKYAADQGHAEASFNLAVGHIHGIKTGLRPGQPTRLLHHAKKNGVEEAEHALSLCARRGCDM